MSRDCWFCGGQAPLLCDGVLAHFSEDGKSISSQAKNFTCDRPLCRTCAKERSIIHYKMQGGCQWDSMDYCADCVKEELQYGPRIQHGYQRKRVLVSMAEGEALQKRRLLKVAGAGNPGDQGGEGR